MYLIIILLVVVLLIIIYLYVSPHHTEKFTSKLNDKFYDTKFICKELYDIYNYNHDMIKKEVLALDKDKWMNWPETNLYDVSDNISNEHITKNMIVWKVFPFYGFGQFAEINMEKCPIISDFVNKLYKKIGQKLKMVSLSKLSPGMKLKQHQGWGNYSNHVIRSHYGIICPHNNDGNNKAGCYIAVVDETEEKQFHKEGRWISFDDSKIHYAENPTKHDRIVLIIDIERPKIIQTGTSTVGDTQELLEFINEMTKLNKIDKIDQIEKN